MRSVTVDKINLGEIVYLFYCKKESRNKPLVIIAHSAGRDKYEGSNLALNLALRDYCVICFDADHHGERIISNTHTSSLPLSKAHIVRQNSYDIHSLIKNHKSDKRIDRTRIALVGIEMGAMSTFYTLTKNNNVSAAVSVLGSPDFIGLQIHSLGANATSKTLSKAEKNEIKNIIDIDPYLYLVENEHRPMLIINGKADDCVPAYFSEGFYEKIKERYVENNTPLDLSLYEESHYFSNDMRDHMIKWLDNNL